MAFTVLVDGVSIHCETAAEAVAVAREAASAGASVASGPSKGSSEKGSATGSRWTEQRIRDFFRVIKPQQRKLIEALLDTSDGRTDEQLCQALGLQDGRSLAGVFTGLYKNAKKVGADPKELYIRDMVSIGDRRVSEYTVPDSFRAAVKKWRT